MLVLLASGCATLPKPQAVKPIAEPASYASAQSFAAPVADWPSAAWWQGFDDPQLTGLIDEGIAGASDLRVAAARFARAQAVVRQTQSQLLPSLSARAEGGKTKQSYNYIVPGDFAPQGWKDYGQGTLNLDWELDFWGRNRAALAAARSESEAAGVEAAAARLTVATGIASAYADLAGLYAELDAVQDAVSVRSHTAELIRGRQAQGLENQGAVERAQSALATAQGEQTALQESIGLAGNRIAALMGAGPDRGLAITRPASKMRTAVGLPANLPAALIGRRPDVIAARLRSEAAASRIKQAHAAFYPNVNLAGVIGLQALGIGNVFKSGSLFGSAGPAISLPIFDGGQLRGQYRAAEADYALAVAEYDGTLTQALHEVADAVTSERVLEERLDHARASERAAAAAWTVANPRLHPECLPHPRARRRFPFLKKDRP
jgi:NodT family efflux transporter outer membrane factor (OMF) lipoprotein